MESEASCSECGSESGNDLKADARRNSCASQRAQSCGGGGGGGGGGHHKSGRRGESFCPRSPSPSYAVSPNSSAAEDDTGGRLKCQGMKGMVKVKGSGRFDLLERGKYYTVVTVEAICFS